MGYCGVQLRYIGGVQRLRAQGGLVELAKNLSGGPEVPQLIGIFLGGQAQDEAVFKQLQAKAFDIAGIGRHVAVEVIHKAVQRVDIDMGVDPETKKLGLVDHTGLAEQLHGVVGADGFLLDGQRLGGELPHPGLYPVQQSLVQCEAALGQDEEGAAEGVLHRQTLHMLAAHHIIEGLQHKKDGAALIGLDAGLVLGGDHLQRTVPVQNLVELAELSVAVDQQDIPGDPVLKVRGYGAVGRSAGVGVRLAVYSNVQHSLFVHRMASSFV